MFDVVLKTFFECSVCVFVYCTCCDVALLVLVVDTEGLLQLLLQRFIVFFNKELGCKLAKLSKLQKSGTF